MQRPTTQELQQRDDAVTISVCDDHVVICPPSHVDLDATHSLVAAAAAGVLSGSTVILDLALDTAGSELVALGPIVFDIAVFGAAAPGQDQDRDENCCDDRQTDKP